MLKNKLISESILNLNLVSAAASAVYGYSWSRILILSIILYSMWTKPMNMPTRLANSDTPCRAVLNLAKLVTEVP
eukprot:SAG31_NODE_7964_length_1554_cov_1.570447_2_plen_75_part_00